MPKYGKRSRKRTYTRNKKRVSRRRKSRKGKSGGRTVGRARTRLGAPTTYQIATKRLTNVRMKFTVNQTYRLVPRTVDGFQSKCHYMTIRANTPFRFVANYSDNPDSAFVWQAQNSEANTGYGPTRMSGANSGARGLDQFYARYQKFTVTGSSLECNVSPTGKATVPIGSTADRDADDSTCPVQAFCFKSSTDPTINSDTNAANISITNYVRRTNFMISDTTQSANLGMNYNARKWEGVKGSTVGNDKFTGTMPSVANLDDLVQPEEEAYYNIGILDARGMARPVIGPGSSNVHDCLPEMQVVLKLTYNVVFSDPRQTSNLVDMGRFGGGAAV
jgi:hypothetical protein